MTTRRDGTGEKKLLQRGGVFGLRAGCNRGEIPCDGSADLRREAAEAASKHVGDARRGRVPSAGNVGLRDLGVVLQKPREGMTHG